MAELDDHVHRILRSEFLAGLVRLPNANRSPSIDVEGEPGHRKAHRRAEHGSAEEQGWPVAARSLRRCTFHRLSSGPHADTSMISGGGSAQVDPIPADRRLRPGRSHVWFPTSPLKGNHRRLILPAQAFEFDSPAPTPLSPPRLAKQGRMWPSSSPIGGWVREQDLPRSFACTENQDALIEQVAARPTRAPSWCSKPARRW